jgi:hypothetical protein
MKEEGSAWQKITDMVNLSNIHLLNDRENQGEKPLKSIQDPRSFLAETTIRLLDNNYKIRSETGQNHNLSRKARQESLAWLLQEF